MSKSMITDQEIKELFDKDVLELIGGKDLPLEKKQELYITIAKTVQNRAIARIYDELTEEEGLELDRLIEGEDSAKVQEYLNEKHLNLQSMLAQEAMAYKLEVYELFKMAHRQPAENTAQAEAPAEADQNN